MRNNRQVLAFLLLEESDDLFELESFCNRNNISAAMLFVLSIYHKKLLRGLTPRKAGYLCRRDLMPLPRVDSPWQAMYRSQEDRAFITTMSVDVKTFNYILRAGFEKAWNTRTIRRGDVKSTGHTRMGRRSLDAPGALGLMLHFLCSTSRYTALQQIFAVVPSVLARYVRFGLPILLESLKNIPEGVIKWPNAQQMTEYLKLINARHPDIDGAFGFLDGLSLPVATSGDPAVENANYNGWLHKHKISNIIAFAPDGTIIYCTINAPGSWHDANVAQNVYGKLLENTPDGRFLIADTAFPKLQQRLLDKIHTPLKARTSLHNLTPAERRAAIKYSNSITAARQAVEWGMRAIQGAFGRLRMPLDANDTEWRCVVIETCLRMHNLRTRSTKLANSLAARTCLPRSPEISGDLQSKFSEILQRSLEISGDKSKLPEIPGDLRRFGRFC
ncbi:hypothetical protein FRC07_008425 [Ceratobasidium sp. 392]|nr:hypothetical protein FRC07_008425 [Ceratobasidium sp. 392]